MYQKQSLSMLENKTQLLMLNNDESELVQIHLTGKWMGADSFAL